MKPDVHGDPAGSLGGGTTGQEVRAFPLGHGPEARHGQNHCEEVYVCREPAHQQAQR